MDQLPRLRQRELICLQLSCYYVVYVWRGFLFLWVLGMGYFILLWHSLSLLYNYLVEILVNLAAYLTLFILWLTKPKFAFRNERKKLGCTVIKLTLHQKCSILILKIVMFACNYRMISSTGCPRKNETHFQFLTTLKLFNPYTCSYTSF